MASPVLGSQVAQVLLIDEEALFREGLCSLLADAEEITVVGDTEDVSEAIALAAERGPHVILLGIRDADGATTAVRRLRQAAPQAAVVILGAHASFGLMQELLSAGVRGFLSRTASGQELIATVRACHESNRRVFLAVPPEALLLSGMQSHGVRLTEREREVLDLTACAMSNAQIAASLGLSEPTVKRHLRNIFSKLGAVSRIDAVNKARAASLISGRRPADFF
ncbi:response regulator transcription factor [Streptomyces spinoverrucosus]|uniref:response regulator transcription factor n=1 Tax=Streptomyces spinoverrucosus TaxID=284043 RepID=UPI0018C39B2A|nr:response regulator transcription factor [Streptomyces spinoverrucosus]